MSNYKQYSIGFLVFNGYHLQDLMGPLEVLGSVKSLTDKPVHPRLVLLSETGGPIKDHLGFAIAPTETFENSGNLDILVVPGGRLETILENKEHPCLEFIRQQATKATYILSICAGALLLAACRCSEKS